MISLIMLDEDRLRVLWPSELYNLYTHSYHYSFYTYMDTYQVFGETRFLRVQGRGLSHGWRELVRICRIGHRFIRIRLYTHPLVGL
jgi:hypothetical protein